MSLKTKLIECLQDLKNVDYTNENTARMSDGKAERALYLIYRAGIKQISFTREEQENFGFLVVDAIKPIQINIESTASVYRTRLDNSVLMKRSAIQFLIDNYSQFPVSDTTLAKKFEDADIGESVEILDDLINKLCSLSDSDEGSSDRESAGSKLLPSSHTWWSK